jgi:DNA primase catalytic core
MEIEKIEFREAIQILAKEAGVELKTDFQRERADAWWDIYALYRATSSWYHEALYKSENNRYLEYLQERKISDETIKKFQLGCSTSPRDLWFYLKEKGFTPQFLIDSGVFISEGRDKFFGRATFPIANSMGHTVAFTGRVLGDALPKYLNSPASKIFDKSSILYGLHLAKQSISKSGDVFIVEGQMDTITLHQAGIENAVGISGTALTKEHIHILKRFAKTIYLCLDSDTAGVKATFLSIETLANEDIEVRIIQIPNGKDPDEYIKSGWVFSDLREDALSPIAFYLKEWGREYDMTTVIWKKKLIEKCLTFLLPLRSQIEVDMHIGEISANLGVAKDAILAEYKKWSFARSTRSRYVPKEEKEEITPDYFTPSELLAGYISSYDFFDLFSADFRYTSEDLSGEGNFSLLSHVIARDTLDPDDEERLKIITLHLEWENPNRDRTIAQKAFSDCLRSVHKDLIIDERDRMKNDPDFRLDPFIQKARTLGLSQTIFQ